MDANAIQIAVRCRPWHPTKELPFIVQPTNQPFFYGDGNLGTSSTRPAAPGALRNVVEVIDSRELDFDKPQDPSGNRRGAFMAGRRYKNRKYVFDQVFSMEASQEEVFERTAKPLLPGVLDGYNATVFAYGATGCGKTHTISGTEEEPGIIVRTMRELFDLVEDTKLQYDTYFQMSMVEIYNETIRDLLSDEYPACPPGGLKLLENEKERVKVANVTNKTPTSVEEVMALVMLGNERRSTSFTARNSTSSRSHLVLQINVVRNERGSDVDVIKSTVTQCSTSATLSIIDLAGSEKASVNRGQRMKEGANINKSLLALSGCISALCQPPVRGVRQHVPYRDSKLTRLLKFSLGGNCRTVMINCISPSSKDIEETNNTLLWADKAKKVSTKVSRNTAGVELRTAQWIQKIVTLEATIKSLEGQLAAGHNASSGMQQRRLNKARTDASEELGRVEKELDELLPVILEGTEMDALWNGSVLQVEALETRLADIEVEIQSGRSLEDAQREKNHIRSLIQQQDQSYRFNSEIQSGIQNKSLKHITLSNLLKKAEERNFDKDLSEAKYEHQIAIMEHQAHVTRSMAAAKERGLRDYIAQQADMATKSASLLSRFSILLHNEVSSLSDGSADPDTIVKRLHSLLDTVDTSVSTLFGESPAPLSVAPTRLPVSLAAPSPRRPSVRGSTSPKRFLRKISPKKNMPLRPSLFGTSSGNSSSAPSEKKGLRWRDEAGEGKIDDRSIAPDCPVFSSPSTNAEESIRNDSSTSSDWEDAKPVQPKSSSPLIPASLRPLGNPPAPPLAPTSAIPPNTGGENTAEIPAWKQMRMMRNMGAQQSIEPIAEESPTKSPIGLGRPSGSGLMGPPARPARPGPLGELHSAPVPSSSRPSTTLSHSTSMSNLLRPTAASAAKSNLPTSNSSVFANVKIPLSSFASSSNSNSSMSMGNTSSSLPSRRVSMIGPARHDRPKQRLSMLPPSSSFHPHSASASASGDLSLSLKGIPVPSSSSGWNTSILASGARRIGGPRSSMLPTSTSGLPRGPRPSIAATAGEGSKPQWK